jgi:hypothetical protein
MEIPEDILRREIYHYLDYETRINLNMYLHPLSRGKQRFTKLQIKQHAVRSVAGCLKIRTNKINDIIEPTRKVREIIKLFELLTTPRFQHIFHMELIRKVMKEKCTSFYNNSPILDELIDKLRAIIDKYTGNVQPKTISV